MTATVTGSAGTVGTGGTGGTAGAGGTAGTGGTAGAHAPAAGADQRGLDRLGLDRLGLALLCAAEWPERPGDVLRPVPGFVVSPFNPLVIEVAERCLRGHYGTPPAGPDRGERTAVILASRRGDTATAAAVNQAVRAGARVPPMLFYQSNPNAVVGYLTARWGLAGPVVCTSPAGDPLDDALDCAAALLGAGVPGTSPVGGDPAEALVIVADLAEPPQPEHRAVALLLTRNANDATSSGGDTTAGGGAWADGGIRAGGGTRADGAGKA